MSTVKAHTDPTSKQSTVKSRRLPVHIGKDAPVPLWNGRLWLDTTNTKNKVLKIYDTTTSTWKVVHIVDNLGDIREYDDNGESVGLENTTIKVPNGSIDVVTDIEGLNTASLFFNNQIPTISGRWYDMLLDGGSKTKASFTLTANTIYAVPFYLSRNYAFDRWAIELAGAVVFSSMRFAIYTINSTTGLPDVLKVESANIDSDTIGNDVGENKTIELEPGWYVKCVWSGSAISLNTLDGDSGGRLLGTDRPDRNCSHTFTRVISFGSYPNPFGNISYKRTSDPHALRFRVA